MNKINLSAYRPIADIQDNIIFANNGNVVLCYEGIILFHSSGGGLLF